MKEGMQSYVPNPKARADPALMATCNPDSWTQGWASNWGQNNEEFCSEDWKREVSLWLRDVLGLGRCKKIDTTN